jgi:hypothetical protein
MARQRHTQTGAGVNMIDKKWVIYGNFLNSIQVVLNRMKLFPVPDSAGKTLSR